MSGSVFVDTSGWASFLVRHESWHELSGILIRSASLTGRPLITTNYVLAELSALFVSPLRLSYSRRLEYLDTIRSARWIRTIHIDVHMDARSWDFMARHRDKDFSLVDCSSFLVMKELGISAAITTDRHFEQAGFTRLLRKE